MLPSIWNENLWDEWFGFPELRDMDRAERKLYGRHADRLMKTDVRAAAREAGLKVGAYHFFRKNRTGKEQADNMLGAIQGKHFDLPLVIDLEDDWGNGATTGRDTALERVLEMISILKDKGYDVMIYTNLDGYNKYYKDMLGDCALWLCSFTSPDLLPDMPHCIHLFSLRIPP